MPYHVRKGIGAYHAYDAARGPHGTLTYAPTRLEFAALCEFVEAQEKLNEAVTFSWRAIASLMLLVDEVKDHKSINDDLQAKYRETHLYIEFPAQIFRVACTARALDFDSRERLFHHLMATEGENREFVAA